MRRQASGVETHRRARCKPMGRNLGAIFVVAVFVNYPWELAQAPLYVAMEPVRTVVWHCFKASLGDGLMVWGIYAAGWAVLRRPRWFMAPRTPGYLVMAAVGLVLGLTVEWVAVHVLQRWAYTAGMPRLLGLDVGLVPVAQMLVLPPLIFYVVAWWRERTMAR